MERFGFFISESVPMSENNPPEANEKAAPVDVKSSVPLEVKITPASVAALGGDAMSATASAAPPEKDPLLLDLDIPRRVPEPTVAQVAAQQATTTTTTVTSPAPALVVKGEGATLAPTTTEAADKVTEGQRRTSLLWESTQAAISLAITGAVIYCAVTQIASETITNAFFFIVATYFTRTNHTKIGGVGAKPYEGR